MDPILVYAAVRVLLALLFLLLQLAILPVGQKNPLLFQIPSFIISFSSSTRSTDEVFAIGSCWPFAWWIFASWWPMDFSYSLACWTLNIPRILRRFAIFWNEHPELQWAGAINASTWDVLFVLQMLLAMNRLSVVLKNSFLITVKKHELPWERRLFNVCVISIS